MIKFDVLNRWSGDIQFTAEIECNENEKTSVKIGLAVKWAIKNDADLSNSNLRDADLSNANLSNANLWDANLSNADLSNADISNANLSNANLSNANLWDANLSNADLRNADLSNANLRNANLSNANLWDAKLRDADLRDADLSNASGLNKFIKCIQIESYSICYTSELIQIGCEKHTIEEWRSFNDERILKMDSKKALNWWRKYKDWLFKTIELCPAEPIKKK